MHNSEKHNSEKVAPGICIILIDKSKNIRINLEMHSQKEMLLLFQTSLED